MPATIKAISISDRKGVRKKNRDTTLLIPQFGLENDAHGGKWHRQVSFLAEESIETMREKGLDVVAGNFAENLTTEGVDLTSLAVGTHIRIAETELVISQLGKICHTRCAIYHQAGDCVMPREGIFAVVIEGGQINVGDQLHILQKVSPSSAIIGSKETERQYGEILDKLVREKFSPAFIRFDVISTKEGGSLPAILDDLTMSQKISNILIFDPSGDLGLNLTGLLLENGNGGQYQKQRSTIYYCRSVEELSSV